MLNFDICVIWWCSDGSINSQEYKGFWNLWSHYQDIYDWISPLNKPSDLWFILTLQSVGRNEYGKFGHLSIFTSLKHLIMLLECNFSQGFMFIKDADTDSMQGHAAQIFFFFFYYAFKKFGAFFYSSKFQITLTF